MRKAPFNEISAPVVFKKGDRIVIRCEEKVVPGEVVLASGNGVSLMISYEAILYGAVGMMPVLWDHSISEFTSLITGDVIRLSRPS